MRARRPSPKRRDKSRRRADFFLQSRSTSGIFLFLHFRLVDELRFKSLLHRVLRTSSGACMVSPYVTGSVERRDVYPLSQTPTSDHRIRSLHCDHQNVSISRLCWRSLLPRRKTCKHVTDNDDGTGRGTVSSYSELFHRCQTTNPCCSVRPCANRHICPVASTLARCACLPATRGYVSQMLDTRCQKWWNFRCCVLCTETEVIGATISRRAFAACVRNDLSAVENKTCKAKVVSFHGF